MTNDPYAWWRAALAGENPPIHDGDPQPGFYRKRQVKGGAFEPVAIWSNLDGMVALAGFDGAQRQEDPAAIWTFCAQNPVTEDAYRAAVLAGRFADVDEAITPPPAGHNAPPEDEAETIREQIEAASASVEKYTTIADDEHAAAAQSLRARLNELAGDAEKKRVAEKAPHLDASKAVDAKWQPIVKAGKAGAETIRKALGAYETKKARAAAEAQRKADEARRKAEEEAAKAAEPNRGTMPDTPHVHVPEPEPPPPVQTTIKGGYGRAASVRVKKLVTVTDQDAAYQSLKTHPELRDLIAKLAQRGVDAGHEIGGVSVEEVREVA